MAEYEVVREIQNSCAGNQMRDVSFDEIRTEDPVAYVKALLGGEPDELSMERLDGGDLTIFVRAGGLRQKFLFTRL